MGEFFLLYVKREIAAALAGVSDYNNCDSWGNVSFDVSGIIAEIKLRTEQGHIRLAFAQLELLYRKPAFVDELTKVWEEPDNDTFSTGY